MEATWHGFASIFMCGFWTGLESEKAGWELLPARLFSHVV